VKNSGVPAASPAGGYAATSAQGGAARRGVLAKIGDSAAAAAKAAVSGCRQAAKSKKYRKKEAGVIRKLHRQHGMYGGVSRHIVWHQ